MTGIWKNKKETINLWEPVRTRAQLYYLKDLNKKKKSQLKNFYCFPFFLKKTQTKKNTKKRKSKKEGEEIKTTPVKLKKVWKNLLGSHQATSIYFVILSHRGVWNFVLFSLSKQGFVHQSNQESLTGYFQSIPEFPSMGGMHRLPRFCRSLFILSSK